MALRDGLISYWNLDEAAGATRVDSHGSNDLSDRNTVAQVSGGGPNGQDVAGFTDATDNVLYIADNADLSFGDEDFSFAGWIYFASFIGNDLFLAKRESGDAAYQFLYKDSAGEDEMWFGMQSSSGGGEVHAKDTGGFSTSTWYFCYGYYDATANEIGISTNDGTVYTQSHAGGAWDDTGLFALGGFNFAGTATTDINGRMAMWGVWGRVLTSSEVTSLYNSGNGLTYAETAETATFTPKTIIF